MNQLGKYDDGEGMGAGMTKSHELSNRPGGARQWLRLRVALELGYVIAG